MSKRSAAFKNGLKQEIISELRADYSEEFSNNGIKNPYHKYNSHDNKLLSIFASICGIKVDELVNILNSTSKKAAYKLLKIDEYNKMMNSLSSAFKAGEEKEHERHLKEEDTAFQRGKKYGAEKRENELRAKYDFIEKRKPMKPYNYDLNTKVPHPDAEKYNKQKTGERNTECDPRTSLSEFSKEMLKVFKAMGFDLDFINAIEGNTK